MRIMLYSGAESEGGLLTHLRLLANGLLAGGHEVTLVLSPSPSVERLAHDCAANGASVDRLSISGKWDFRNQARLKKLVSTARPDVFHLHLSSPVEGMPVILATRAAGSARIVTTEHAPTWHPLRRRYSAISKRLTSRLLDAVIALSDSDARFLAGEFGVPESLIRVIRNGVPGFPSPPQREAARARFGFPVDALLVGYLGAIERKKGLADLLSAASSCALPKLAVVLAGQGAFAAELIDHGKKASFHLVLLGEIGRENVGPFLASLDIFAFPSLQEAMPLALLEAMSAGLPIVATRVGGIPEALQHGVSAILVEPARPKELAAALRTLADNPAGAAAMGAAARRAWSERFSDRRMVDELVRLYEDLCGTRG